MGSFVISPGGLLLVYCSDSESGERCLLLPKGRLPIIVIDIEDCRAFSGRPGLLRQMARFPQGTSVQSRQ